MTLTNLAKAPFPWFGGKSQAASAVWAALGDVEHYVEPFAGSLAVLLNRPHLANRPYHSETVNDADGLLVNAWRGIQLQPDATADAASWPVSEADLHARHVALVRWREEHQLEHLMGDAAWCDPVMAGWWLWGCSCWIGGGWCSGRGGWTADERGWLVRGGRGERGVADRQLPHIGHGGKGVNHAGTREPGVKRQLPHLGTNGMGVNHAGTREPGVGRQLPHLTDDGMGVNRPQGRALDTTDGYGEYHPVTMPELRRWFAYLSARLRHVRIINGDWRRVVTSGASKTLNVRKDRKCHAGIFLDPPYSSDRASDLYSVDSMTVAEDVRAWCAKHGDDPKLRIVLAGYAGDPVPDGWREVEWYADGWLQGGYGNEGDGHQQHRERLWCSPACLVPSDSGPLFAGLE